MTLRLAEGAIIGLEQVFGFSQLFLFFIEVLLRGEQTFVRIGILRVLRFDLLRLFEGI